CRHRELIFRHQVDRISYQIGAICYIDFVESGMQVVAIQLQFPLSGRPPLHSPLDALNTRAARIADGSEAAAGGLHRAEHLIVRVIAVKERRVHADLACVPGCLGTELVGPNTLGPIGRLSDYKVESAATEALGRAGVDIHLLGQFELYVGSWIK